VSFNGVVFRCTHCGTWREPRQRSQIPRGWRYGKTRGEHFCTKCRRRPDVKAKIAEEQPEWPPPK
jgi:hypothetical protein